MSATRSSRLTPSLLLVLVLAPGCGRPAPGQHEPVDLLEAVQEDATAAVAHAEIAIGGVRKRAIVLRPAQSVTVPLSHAPPGSRLLFDYASVGREVGATRLRVSAIGPGGGPATRILFEETLPTTLRSWRFASLELPSDVVGSGSLRVEGIALGQEPSRAVVWADPILLGPDPAGREGRPNVVIVSLDTTRADHLSLYGYERDTTPFLRRLAEESVVFERAYTPSTWTLPSHSSLFTGLYPSEHGAITTHEWLGGLPLEPDKVTLAEVLGARGYLTMGVVAGPYLKRRFGVDQGFVYYSDLWDTAFRDAYHVNDQAMSWLDRVGERPFLLFLNYFDAHAPYDPPGYAAGDESLLAAHGIDPKTFDWFELKKAGEVRLPPEIVALLVDRYDGEIRILDRALRELMAFLDERGLLEETIVCVLGDHGESFGELGLFGHGGPFYESQARVPLVYRAPRRLRRGERVREPISLVDVPSTILRDLGGPLPASFGSRGELERAPVYGERFTSQGSMRMLVVGPMKYVVRLRHVGGELVRDDHLYDLSLDPAEASDLASNGSARLAELRSRYEAVLAEIGVAPETRRAVVTPGTVSPASGDEALRQQLQALGYVR